MENLNLPFLTKEVIIGLILGDASNVRKYPNGNAYFKYAQSVKHAEYLDLVFSHFKPFCNMTSPTLVSANIQPTLRNNTYGVLSFSTRSLPCFTELHTLFYLNGIKFIPSNIADLLTPAGLAFWSMDDGSKCSKGFHLNTNAFSLEDLDLLFAVLRDKFNLTLEEVEEQTKLDKNWEKLVTLYKQKCKASIIAQLKKDTKTLIRFYELEYSTQLREEIDDHE